MKLKFKIIAGTLIGVGLSFGFLGCDLAAKHKVDAFNFLGAFGWVSALVGVIVLNHHD